MNIDALFRDCIIEPGCFDHRSSRARTLCEASSRSMLGAFLHTHLSSDDRRLVRERKLDERALVTATALLGDDGESRPALIALERRLHLFLTVQMTWQWIVDEVVDARRGRNCDALFTVLHEHLIPATQSPEALERARRTTPEDPACAQLIRAVLPMIEWWRALGRNAGVDMGPDSLVLRFNREFLESLPHLWDDFDSWPAYEDHRARNCALNPLVVCRAQWQCHIQGEDWSSCERALRQALPLFHRYGVLGGLSNDLFGYDKDVVEGMATSVEVCKRLLAPGHPPTGPDHPLTARAFEMVIQTHNARCVELHRRIHDCRDVHESVLLSALLATAHSIRDLHLEAISIYGGGTLQAMLEAGRVVRAS